MTTNWILALVYFWHIWGFIIWHKWTRKKARWTTIAYIWSWREWYSGDAKMTRECQLIGWKKSFLDQLTHYIGKQICPWNVRKPQFGANACLGVVLRVCGLAPQYIGSLLLSFFETLLIMEATEHNYKKMTSKVKEILPF